MRTTDPLKNLQAAKRAFDAARRRRDERATVCDVAEKSYQQAHAETERAEAVLDYAWREYKETLGR